jgi:lysozyme family protein
MANLQSAVARTLRFEDSTLSGKVTHDAGGWTRFGIAEKYHPEVFPEMLTCSRERALELAAEVLKRYWCFDGVQEQEIAWKLFDMAVNLGLDTSIRLCQRAVGVPVDGKWGPKTEAAANARLPLSLMEAFRQAATEHYREVVAVNPANEKFLNGWLARAGA